jgi:FKBP-type peptidyl-prolyl cis-trans isomerase
MELLKLSSDVNKCKPLIAGLDELLTGMRPGEKRRALIPPMAGYVTKGLEPQPPDFGRGRATPSLF